jgi:hypothetical protein
VTQWSARPASPIFSAIHPQTPAGVNAATGAALIPRAKADVRHKGCEDGSE